MIHARLSILVWPPAGGRDHSSYLVEVAAQLLVLGGERLDTPLGDTVLVQGGLKLALDVVVVRLQLRQLGREEVGCGQSGNTSGEAVKLRCRHR